MLWLSTQVTKCRIAVFACYAFHRCSDPESPIFSVWSWAHHLTFLGFSPLKSKSRNSMNLHTYNNNKTVPRISQFSCSVMLDSLRPHGLQQARPPCPSPTPGVYSNISIESVVPSNHLILCHPFLLLPSIFPSIRVFSNESALHIRWPKHWSFSFYISPSNEHPGLISFRMD